MPVRLCAHISRHPGCTAATLKQHGVLVHLRNDFPAVSHARRLCRLLHKPPYQHCAKPVRTGKDFRALRLELQKTDRFRKDWYRGWTKQRYMRVRISPRTSRSLNFGL